MMSGVLVARSVRCTHAGNLAARRDPAGDERVPVDSFKQIMASLGNPLDPTELQANIDKHSVDVTPT